MLCSYALYKFGIVICNWPRTIPPSLFSRWTWIGQFSGGSVTAPTPEENFPGKLAHVFCRQDGWSVCYPTNRPKAPQDTRSTDLNQWYSLPLSWSITGLLRLEALLHLLQLWDAGTSRNTEWDEMKPAFTRAPWLIFLCRVTLTFWPQNDRISRNHGGTFLRQVWWS